MNRMVAPLEPRGRRLARTTYRLALRAGYWSGLSSLVLGGSGGDGRCTVFLYHGVAPDDGKPFAPNREKFVSPAAFERQLRFLKRQFDVVPLGEALATLERRCPLGARTAVITFDDGYLNNLTLAYPVLKAYRLPFTIFLVTGYLGDQRTVWWDELERMIAACGRSAIVTAGGVGERYDLGRPAEKLRLFHRVAAAILSSSGTGRDVLPEVAQALDFRAPPRTTPLFLSWMDVKELARDPLVEFGSHSVSHAIVSRLPKDRLAEEIVESKREIEAAVGREVTAFAYPYGRPADFSTHAIAALRTAGYRCALTGIEGPALPGDDLFKLRRVSILRGDTWADFVSRAASLGAFLRGAGARWGRAPYA